MVGGAAGSARWGGVGGRLGSGVGLVGSVGFSGMLGFLIKKGKKETGRRYGRGSDKGCELIEKAGSNRRLTDVKEMYVDDICGRLVSSLGQTFRLTPVRPPKPSVLGWDILKVATPEQLNQQ